MEGAGRLRSAGRFETGTYSEEEASSREDEPVIASERGPASLGIPRGLAGNSKVVAGPSKPIHSVL
jgi:hypothetical protein